MAEIKKENLKAPVGKKRFPCDQCEKTFTRRGDVKRHKKAIHQGVTYPCNICYASISCEAQLKKHVIRFHSSDECKFCDFKDTKVNVKYHIRRNHVEEWNKEKAFTCKLCAVKLTNKRSLRNHMKTVHIEPKVLKPKKEKYEGRYNCSQCEKSYSRNEDLKDHISGVHNKIAFPCNDCGKLNMSKKALRCHKKVHFVNSCEECDFKGTRSELRKHMTTLHPIKKQPMDYYDCQKCNYTTTQFGMLEKHKIRKHPSLKCQRCTYEADGLHDLKRHIFQHDMLKCNQCYTYYKTKDSLLKHQQNIHAEVTCVECELKVQKKDKESHKKKCKEIMNERKLQELSNVSIILPFQCSHCDFRAKYEEFINSHVQYFHNT